MIFFHDIFESVISIEIYYQFDKKKKVFFLVMPEQKKNQILIF